MKDSANNLKSLRKRNMAEIAFRLMKEGNMSRLQISQKMGLTTAAITQIVQELIQENIVKESVAVQRNNTGRKEMLLEYNDLGFCAIGVNIESDKTHFSLCSYNKVIEEIVVLTSDLNMMGGNVSHLIENISKLYVKYKGIYNIMGICVGISGTVIEKEGISENSYGILPKNYPLLEQLKNVFDLEIFVINNIRAQARSLINSYDDNYLYVKHSPGLGCALVVNGQLLNGHNNNAGELGHTVVEKGGALCSCGKRGCLETLISESQIIKEVKSKTNNKYKIEEVYKKYGKDLAVSEILDKCLDKLAVSIGNAAMLTDPHSVVITGGIFMFSNLRRKFLEMIREYGFFENCNVTFIENNERIKAYAEARHTLLKLLFEV